MLDEILKYEIMLHEISLHKKKKIHFISTTELEMDGTNTVEHLKFPLLSKKENQLNY